MSFYNCEKTDEAITKHDKHILDKDITRQIKREKKEEANENKDVTTAAFDLEQVLLSPYGPTGAFYYSRRLQNHNLTVTEINTMKTYAYLWNEHEVAKGSCEVATCVLKFLKAKKEEGAMIVYLFCD